MCVIGINPVSNQIPEKYELFQNYPNPFNPKTKIRFAIPKSSFTRLIIYDILGCETAVLVNEQLQHGTYEFDFEGSTLASGVYFYKLVAGDHILAKKMILVK